MINHHQVLEEQGHLIFRYTKDLACRSHTRLLLIAISNKAVVLAHHFFNLFLGAFLKPLLFHVAPIFLEAFHHNVRLSLFLIIAVEDPYFRCPRSSRTCLLLLEGVSVRPWYTLFSRTPVTFTKKFIRW